MLTEYSEWREKQAEIDAASFAALIDRVDSMKARANKGHAGTIDLAMRHLATTPLPEAYLEGIRFELLQMLGQEHVDRTFAYMTFWGMDGRAEFMKIGVAKDVRARMMGIRTGNPMERLWTFKMVFNSRSEAMRVESALLSKMSADRVSGEWIRMAKCSAQACQAIADDLAAVASELVERPIDLLCEG